MLITIDVGNTSTAVGIYTKSKLLAVQRISTKVVSQKEEWNALINEIVNALPIASKIEGVIISSVVPVLDEIISEVISEICGLTPLIVDGRKDMGIKLKVDRPEDVGADRIANAVAALILYGKPSIVVDFGTATTFDVISKDGCYIGGLITVGIEMGREALWEKTAKLPRIELKAPTVVIGKNTIQNIQSGIFYGFRAMTEGIIRRIKEELSPDEAVVIATGGLSKFIWQQDFPCFNYLNQTLSLEGLRLIWRKWSEKCKHSAGRNL